MSRARFMAMAILVLAALWIGSGFIGAKKSPDAKANRNVEKPLFRVVTSPAKVEPHARRIELTGRTQSDQRVMVSARTGGIVEKLVVRRGSAVKLGDVIAELSDDAREAQVAQGRARLAQRKAELNAREALAKKGSYPLLNLEQLRAEMRAAEAALAQAEAEQDRTTITAPVAGIVNDLPIEVGQGLAIGSPIAEIIVPNPMLAIIEVPERRLAGLKIGDKAEIALFTGEKTSGTIRFIARKPSGTTRTYRVDVVFDNTSGAIADGIAAEVALVLAPTPSAQVPRSALVFSSDGRLGLRFVDAQSIVQFAPVSLIDDEQEMIWIAGIAPDAKIITRGQEFVREGSKVEAVPAQEKTTP
jgi:membrane fusion protein, multidrug efflux system